VLLLSSTDDGDDYLLFTANALKEKQISFANFSVKLRLDFTKMILQYSNIQSNLPYVTFQGTSEIWSHKEGGRLILV